MKKVLRILSIPIAIVLIIMISVLYIINHNNNTLKNITKEIKENYKIKEDITYSNQYNNYYIFTTKKSIIVLNNEYKEILKEKITTIKKKAKEQELIYKTNKLMFEEKEIKGKKLIYKYYDAKTGEFIKETIMERK